MVIRNLTLAGLLAFAPPCASHGQPAPHRHARRAAAAAPQAAGRAAMPLDTWFTLEAQATVQAPPKAPGGLDTSLGKDDTEYVTVLGHRVNRDAEWRAELQAAEPVYEANNSAAAQRLYAPSPIWYTPDQQRLMSDTKAELGLCGALGGWVSCPNTSP